MLSGVIAIKGGNGQSLALKSDGTVVAWGRNVFGQLGDGTTTQRTTPVQVKDVGGVGVLSGVSAISGGELSSAALKTDGTVVAWGQNSLGNLGDGTTTQRTTPVQVKDVGGVGVLSGIVSLDLGEAGISPVALKNDGTVVAWGFGAFGQMGDGTTNNELTPVQVKDVGGAGVLSGVSAIAAGSIVNMALKNDGTVVAWGAGFFKNLGDGTTTTRLTPVRVLGVTGVGFLSGISDISVGTIISFALQPNGTGFAWGNGDDGALGNGVFMQSTVPVQMVGLPIELQVCNNAIIEGTEPPSNNSTIILQGNRGYARFS